jgi:hypothetical protein
MGTHDLENLFLQHDRDNEFTSKRQLYTLPKDGKECENCARIGK